MDPKTDTVRKRQLLTPNLTEAAPRTDLVRAEPQEVCG